ncbi:TolC family protein [bacterium]|nr:MAG: TolC family protein [bacterium]
MKHALLAVVLALGLSSPGGAQPASQILTLATALAEANAHNPDVLAARSSVQAAQAGLEQAVPQPLQIEVSQGVTRDVPQGLGTLQTFTAGVSQQLSPALGAQRRAAASGVAVAQAQYAVAERGVDQRVIASYYALASAQAAVAAARLSVDNAQELERSAGTRARVGDVGRFEVLRAQVETRRAQTDLLRAQAGEAVARIALNVLLGRAADAPATVQLSAPPASLSDVQGLYAEAAQLDPLLAQYRAAIDQASAQARAAQLRRLPAIGLQGGYLFQRAPGAAGATSVGPLVGVTLTLPLIDYGAVRGAIREARAGEKLARALYVGRDGQLRGELSEASAQIGSAQARLEFSDVSLKQAREGLRLAQFGYERGALGVLDVLSARNELASAQSEVTQATADLAAAVASLRLMIGVPVTP